MKTILNKKSFVLYLASHILNLFLLLPFAFILFTCSTNDPPPVEEKKKITLSVDEVTTTEAWLKLVTQNIELPKELTLLRDGDTTETFILSVNDTVIYQSSLLPSKSYTYQASINQDQVISNELTVETMDTTSHNYSWEEITLGEFQSSLYDVWGTDENNVYAVGGVTLNGEFYGVLHYNGSEWIPIPDAGGYAIYGFSENDIWVVGGGVFHYDGVEWKSIDSKTVNHRAEILDTVLFENTSYYSVWGTSSSDLYLGSTWGKIIHWDGSKGEVMDVQASSDVSNIDDIWGVSRNEVYAVAGNGDNSVGELFYYNGNSWSKIADGSLNPTGNQLRGPFNSIWQHTAREQYIVGEGVLTQKEGNWSFEQLGFYMEKVRGNKQNNIFISGHYNNIAHYNGISWYRYSELSGKATILRGVYVTEHEVFVVGFDQVKAVIYRGKLN